MLVADSTGSMGPALASVQAAMTSIVGDVQTSQPAAEFAVVDYKDVVDGSGIFTRDTDLTASASTVQNAVNSLSAGGGGDLQEAQLNALWQIGSGGNAISYRPGSSRIVVWFGDASGHDPSNGHTLADAEASLEGVSARVIGINVASGEGDGLDATGQATAIASATGGSYLPSVNPSDVATAILSGLHNLPAEVTSSSTCDTGLSVGFTPSLPQTVQSGDSLVLDEAITVAADAPQGSTLTCKTNFLINGADAGPDFIQTVNIYVNDVTPPTVSCGPGVNPAGKTPAVGRTPGSSRWSRLTTCRA
ncbi:vWA domain-containing protein [Flexivirga alba]|uniref:vWA domain-containing protein n=1 Tax=Flexivirga alba TaxID=702742 RepID=UPI0036D3C5C3